MIIFFWKHQKKYLVVMRSDVGKIGKVCAAVIITFFAFYSIISNANMASKLRYTRSSPTNKSNITHLIMVAGHTSLRQFGSYSDSKQWFLFDYQRSQFPIFQDHIKMGVSLVARDEKSFLLYSGAQQHIEAGPITEALSYWMTAHNAKWFGHSPDVNLRVSTEEFALDSFENLLFSVCRFKQLTQNYPTDITVISLEFKRKR